MDRLIDAIPLPRFLLRQRYENPIIYSGRRGKRTYFCTDKTGALIHVSGAEHQKNPLYCPDCSQRVTVTSPRFGSMHFRHEGGEECRQAGLSAVGQMGTTVFTRHGRIALPDLKVNGERITPAVQLQVSAASLEPGPQMAARDLRLTLRDDAGLEAPLVVMFDTGAGHDEQKAERLRWQAIDVLLIDLRGIRGRLRLTSLAQALVSNAPRYWLHHRLLGPVEMLA